MRFHFYAIFICAATLAFSNAASAGDAHSHSCGHGIGAVQLTLNNGAKWQTDKALRDGMWNIRYEMENALPDIHKGSMSKDRYAVLAGAVQKHVDGMVAGCKLSPEADVRLHIVLAKVIEGVEVMKG